MKRSTIIVVMLGLFPSTTFALEDTHCEYSDFDKNVYLNEACHVSYKDGQETYSFKDGTKIIVEIVDRQGQDAIIKFNGKNGYRYEIDRTQFHFVSTDLKETLDYQNLRAQRR